jgi:hypothetical protein
VDDSMDSQSCIEYDHRDAIPQLNGKDANDRFDIQKSV